MDEDLIQRQKLPESLLSKSDLEKLVSAAENVREKALVLAHSNLDGESEKYCQYFLCFLSIGVFENLLL